MTPRRSPQLLSLLTNVGILLATIVVMVLVLEWLLRVTDIQRVLVLNPPIYRASSDGAISYELIPSISRSAYGETVTTDARGFRSPPVDARRPLIAMLGDSVTFGFGVGDDQTVASNLQRLLPGFSVLNAGVPGYNGLQEAEQLSRNIAPMHPAAVVLTFVFNDFDETMTLDRDGYFAFPSRPAALPYAQRLSASINGPGTLPIPFKAFLQTHSALFGLLERMTKGLRFRTHAPQNSIFQDNVTDAELAAYGRQVLHRMAQTVPDAKKLLVIWPEEALHLRSREVLKAMAQREGFHVLDFYEILGNRYESLGWEGHPSPRQNASTAAVLAEALRAMSLLPAVSPSAALR